jgi:two-component system sensor histidine kinase UhpB
MLGRRIPLFWLVFGTNGVLLVVAGIALALAPVEISAPIALYQALIVAASVVALLVANFVLLRRIFSPLEHLAARMRAVDLLRPGQRVSPSGHAAEMVDLVTAFNEMLDRLERERQASGRRALEAQEAERLRISRGLHDEVGQALTGVLLSLNAFSSAVPEARRAELTDTMDAVRSALEEVRRIAAELRPQMLDDLGLVSALTELAQTFTRRTGIGVESAFPVNMPRLSRQLELALYRVAQEALTNVARHANATAVRLELRQSASDLELRVIDNGRGLPASTVEAHGGLRGMRERAVLVDGSLVVQEGPEGGVEVRFTVPNQS